MKNLATALALTTCLIAPGAVAQVADPVDVGVDPVDGAREYGFGERGYYGAGIGADYGTDLGYGYGYGAGLLGGTIDESLYEVGFDDLYDAEIVGADGEEIGEVQEIVRSCNIYAVVNIDADWLDIGSREIVVPINQLIVTGEGVLVEGITRNNINQFPNYRAGIGLTEIGYGGDTGLTDVGGLYGAAQGWGACQRFAGAGAGGGAVEADAVDAGGALEVDAVDAGADPVDVGEGVGAGAGAGIGSGMQQNMLQFSLDALEGADVFGPGDRELGRIDRLVRSNNIYVVMNIDTGWFGAGGTAVVPLQRFVWTGEGLMLPGVTEETIGEYRLGRGVYGGFWDAGYAEIDEGYYDTVGGVYGFDD